MGAGSTFGTVANADSLDTPFFCQTCFCHRLFCGQQSCAAQHAATEQARGGRGYFRIGSPWERATEHPLETKEAGSRPASDRSFLKDEMGGSIIHVAHAAVTAGRLFLLLLWQLGDEALGCQEQTGD